MGRSGPRVRRCTGVLAALSLIGLAASAAAAPWQYGYRKRVTVDHLKVSANLANFPVLVSLSSDLDLRTVAHGGRVQNANGYDVVFRASDGSKLDFEVEKYTSSPAGASLIAWVRIPNLSSITDTDLYIYYGNASITCSQEYAAGVWDSDFAGVWHLKESPAGAAPQAADSTDGNHDATSAGAMTAGDQVPGQVDGSLDFDGVDDYLATPDAPRLDISSSFTIEAWARWAGTTTNSYILEKGGAGGFENNYYLWWNDTQFVPNTSLVFGFSTGTAFRDLFYDWTPTAGQWYHVVGVFDDAANQLRIYVDGVQVASKAEANVPGLDNGELRIGRDSKGVWGGNVWWDGLLDEVRLSRAARTAAWIQTEYNNQSWPTRDPACTDGGFACVGAEEPGPWSFPWIYGYRKKLTVDSARVTCGSDLGSFPVLVSLTDSDLRTRAKGGRVEHGMGADIVFRASDGLTSLDFEVERYDGSSGNFIAWVRIPTLSTSLDTDIYMYYGNPDVACSSQTQNPAGVWDASYQGVWHMKEDPSGGPPQVKDSTSRANHGASGGAMTSGDQIQGTIDGALDFDGGDDFLNLGDDVSLHMTNTTSMTISAWVNTRTAGNVQTVVRYDDCDDADGDTNCARNLYMLRLETNRVQLGYGPNAASTVFSSPSIGTNTWYYVAGTRDVPMDTENVYINGVLDASETDTTTGTWETTGQYAMIGRFDRAPDVEFFDGRMDEVRISNVARSSCWIETEYNSQSQPTKNAGCSDAGFICVGAEEAGPPTAVELASFTATPSDGAVVLEWETASELDNLGFEVYVATAHGGPYARLTPKAIPGLGSSPVGARYRFVDSGRTNGVTYFYKLVDVDTAGVRTPHGPVAATPGSDAGALREGGTAASPASLLTYGRPEASSLRVLSWNERGATVELSTEGFYAEPMEDGSVRLTVPGIEALSEGGAGALPVARPWVDVVAGSRVTLASVEESSVEVFPFLRPSGLDTAGIEGTRSGVVHLRRGRPGRTTHARAEGGLFPREAARVLGSGFQGDVERVRLELAPLRFSHGGLRLSRRLVVRLVFQGRRSIETSRRRSLGGAESTTILARLATKDEGLHVLRYEDVFPRRSGAALYARRLRLSRSGTAVPFHLEPEADRFGPGSRIYFLGEGADANPYGNDLVYELELAPSGLRMATRSGFPSGDDLVHSRKRSSFERDQYYQAGLLEAPDPWLWDVLLSPAAKSYSFEIDALARSSEPSRVEVHLQGASDFGVDPDHHVRLFMNGVFLGETRWSGKSPGTLAVEIPHGVLAEGANSLEIENVPDTDAAYSLVFLDRFSVDYPRRLEAERDRFEGRAPASGVMSLPNLGESATVVDVTEPSRPLWLRSVARGAENAVRFQVEENRRYVAASAAGLLHPEVRRPRVVRLKSPRNEQPEYLAIAPEAFFEPLEPLLRIRREQGLKVRAVAIEQIYDEFGYGESRPEALREFLSHAYHEWGGSLSAPGRRLRYVLLVGDATYDFKDRLGTGVVNRIPPLMVKTSYLWTASDPTLAMVHGEDGLPDLAIGRLPAATAPELRSMIGKILAYEEGSDRIAAATAPLVLVVDDPDEAGDFDADADELLEGILAGRNVDTIRLSELGASAARSRVLRAFDEGSSLLSYIGHGGIHLWADENLLDIRAVASMAPQPRQPLFVTMNCLNGYFHFPYFNSLGEELLKADGKGVLAAFSPSGLSLDGPAHRYHRAFLAAVLQRNHGRLGDAVLAAQEEYAGTGAFPELISIYHLLGDPALTLR